MDWEVPFSPDELTKIVQSLNLLKKDKLKGSSFKQVREIVPIEKWLGDEYYVGEDGLRLYDFWKEQMVDIFGTNKGKYNEIILTGSIGCLSLDTRYWTSKGVFSLRELINMSSLGEVFDVKTEIGIETVSKVHNKGFQPTKKIRFSNGIELEGSFDHRIRGLVNGKVEWVRFDQLTKETPILYSKKPESFDGVKFDVDESYFMGYLFGDGGCTVNKRVKRFSPTIFILFRKDQSNCERMIELSKRYIGGDPEYSNSVNFEMVQVRKVNRDLYYKWGGIGNSYTKSVPSWFFSTSLESRCSFLAGLWDSDGSVGKGSMEYCTNSLKLADDVRLLLQGIGINCSVRKYEKKNRIHIQGKKNWKRFLELVPLEIDYKKKRLEDLCKTPYSSNERTILTSVSERLRERNRIDKCVLRRENGGLTGWRNPTRKQEITLETITRLKEVNKEWVDRDPDLNYILENEISVIFPVSIEEGYSEVGDIEVEGSHTYRIGGLISHNTGKSTAALFMLFRRMYELSCFEGVQQMFGLMPASLIVFFYFSVSKIQAELSGFGQLKSFLDGSPYFNNFFQRDLNISSIVKFPQNIMFLPGSDPSHVIGLNLIGSILDEANFFQGESATSRQSSQVSEYSKVARMYSSIVTRGRSRFIKDQVNHSLSILVSSSTHQSSFTEQRMQAARESPGTKVITTRLWEIKGKGTFSSKLFPVFIGSQLLDPFVVESPAEVNQFLSSVNEPPIDLSITPIQAVDNVPDIYKHLFVKVPWDFKDIFNMNIIQALQDVAGVSISPLGKLFTSRQVYNESIDSSMSHPFYKESFIISTGESTEVKDFLRKDWIPDDIEKPRFFHIDQSLANDSTGLACSYVKDYVRTKSGDLPIIANDLKIRIDPPRKPQQISVQKVRDFIFYLRDTVGLKIGKVTMDQYACETKDSLVLTKEGYKYINEVKKGDYVATRSGYRKVLNTFEYKDAPVRHITMQQGYRISVTPNHKLHKFIKWEWKQKGVWEWTESRELQPGDRLNIILNKDKELREVYLKGLSKVKNRSTDLVTDGLAYLIGYAIGDGVLGKDGISYAFGSLSEAENLQSRVEVEFGYTPNIVSYKGRPSYFQIHISSRDLRRILEENGYRRAPSHKKTIPSFIFNLPRSGISSFIGGYADADGNISKNDGALLLTSTSRKLLEQVQVLLAMSLGIKSGFSVMKNCSGPKRYPNGKVYIAKECYVLRTSGPRSNLKRINSTKVQGSTQFDLVKGRRSPSRIASIEEGVETVYAIEVEGTHSYISNGFFSHNSAEALQALREGGVDAELLSVDRTDDAYLSYIQLMFEGRLKTYNYPVFERELFDLMHDRSRRKVDHPMGGCFVGSTKVRLPRNRWETIANLVNSSGHLISAKLPDTERYVSQYSNCWQSKIAYRTVKVFYSGGSFECTPEHKIWTTDGWREAQHLAGCSLSRFNFSFTKVFRVVPIDYAEGIPVYDIEVPQTSCFVIEDNIIVHNSKDVADAVVGSVKNALDSEYMGLSRQAGALAFTTHSSQEDTMDEFDLVGGDIYGFKGIFGKTWTGPEGPG